MLEANDFNGRQLYADDFKDNVLLSRPQSQYKGKLSILERVTKLAELLFLEGSLKFAPEPHASSL